MPHLKPGRRPTPSPDARLTPERVVRALTPLTSRARRERLDSVLSHRLATVTVVLENLRDPHNGAAALRTCEAMGLTDVHVVEERETFRSSPKVCLRSDKWINVHHHPTAAGCLDTLLSWGFSCHAALPPELGCATGPGDWPAADRPVALVFGNEHYGLSEAAVERCNGRFAIPMQGFMESLNLSVSVAITVVEMTRRRREHLGRTGDLPPEALTRMRAGYYARAVGHAAEVVLRDLKG